MLLFTISFDTRNFGTFYGVLSTLNLKMADYLGPLSVDSSVKT